MTLGAVLGFAVAMGASCGQAKCSPTNCMFGCCDAMGVCQAGTTTSQCGGSGANCTACGLGEGCELNRCTLNGGTGGGTGGGGTGGGTTGGGAGGGGGGDAGTTFCDRVQAGTDHLRAVLQNCPGPGDSTVYGFSRAKCDSMAASACTVGDEQALDAVMACDRRIAPCVTDAGYSVARQAISACVYWPDAGTVMISTSCMNSISP